MKSEIVVNQRKQVLTVNENLCGFYNYCKCNVYCLQKPYKKWLCFVSMDEVIDLFNLIVIHVYGDNLVSN